MLNTIRAIAVKHYNGDTRRGPRHEYIIKQLRKRGCKPYVDQYQNIWVEKGSGKKLILFSSHIDVDPHIHNTSFKSRKSGSTRIIRGVLDDAAGCYINLLLAQEGPRNGRAIYVFTASEEVDKKNHARFARSAQEVVRQLKTKGVIPDLCVAIDVTYPRFKRYRKRLDWGKQHNELFDMSDTMHCYLDGYSDRRSKKIGAAFVKRFKSANVKIREFYGHDEAHVYSRISPAFAFGPVVYGRFDRPKQEMPLVHVKTALRFLRKIR